MNIKLGILLCCLTGSVAAETFSDIAPQLGSAWQQGRFEQKKIITGLPKPLLSSGHFALAQAQLNWRTTAPFSSEVIFSAKGISQWQNGKKVWEMTEQEQPIVAVVSQLMLAMMTGQWQALDQAFAIESFQMSEQGCWSLDVTTLDPLFGIVVKAMSLNGCAQVNQIEIIEVSGNSTVLSLFAEINDAH